MNNSSEKFKKWMINVENKKISTANNYSRAVNEISRHLSEQKGKEIDLFDVTDIKYVKEIIMLYSCKLP